MTNVIPTEAKPALDYLESAFTKPQYDARVAETKYEYFYPTSGTRNTNVLRWTLPHKGKGQIVPDLNKMVLAPSIKVTNQSKTGPPPLDYKSAPCNNFMLSIFNSLRINFNTTTVLKLDHYAIYNYLRMRLNCDNNDLGTWATTRCFFDEATGEDFDNINTTGWTQRRNQFGGIVKKPLKVRDKDDQEVNNPELNKFVFTHQPIFFIGSLDHFLPTPPFLSNVDIHVELELSKPSYVFQSEDDTMNDINFDFDSCRLFVPQTKLNDKLFVQIEARLAKEAMRQFFTSTQVNTYSISTGNKVQTFDCVASGFNPSRLYLTLQEQERINGKFSLNCFKFPLVLNKGNPFRLKSMRVTLQGEEVEGLSCDKSQYSFKDEYFRLFHLTKQDGGKNACSLTYRNFLENTCVLIYDFTTSLNGTEPPLLPLVREGHLRVEVEFDKPSTCPITLIAICEMQSAVTIENSGKCTLTTV